MAYESPTIVDHGTLIELTSGQANGSALDKAFVVATPKADLTFS